MLVSKEVAELLSFEKFANEVQKAYEKAGSQKGVSVWYKETYRSQKGWPGNPYGTYKEKGWEGWPKLIGKEVKEQITFEDFTLEVREEYKKMGSPADTYNWYSSINKIHPGWPASPGHTYKEKGWRSWPELVGKEVVKFLPFDDFLNEVRHEYKKDNEPSAVQVWYKTIYKQHPGWPSTPNDTYQSDGWVNYATMIDKKTYDFSTFTEFETAVREVYEEAGRPGNVIKWYTTEQKNHPGWQTKPNQKYQNQGWMGWPQLVGKK